MKQLVLSLAIIGLMTAIGFAQEPPPPPGEAGMAPDVEIEKVIMRECGMADLSAEQKEGMEAARLEAQKTIIPIKADIELKQIDLKTEMKKDKIDRAKIMKIAKEINDLEWKIKQADIDQKIKIHSLLTPEQREKMKMKMMMMKMHGPEGKCPMNMKGKCETNCK